MTYDIDAVSNIMIYRMYPASEMTYTVSGGALNSTQSNL